MSSSPEQQSPPGLYGAERRQGPADPGVEALARITPYRDGPYLVRGPFTLIDQEGNEIEVRRKVIALCRCGRSQTRPFCDGTHKAIGFQAESGSVAGAAGEDGADRER